MYTFLIKHNLTIKEVFNKQAFHHYTCLPFNLGNLQCYSLVQFLLSAPVKAGAQRASREGPSLKTCSVTIVL